MGDMKKGRVYLAPVRTSIEYEALLATCIEYDIPADCAVVNGGMVGIEARQFGWPENKMQKFFGDWMMEIIMRKAVG